MATSSGRLTLSYSARAGRFGLPVDKIPEIPLELVRSVEITENFHRCKKNFVNFCKEGFDHRGHRGTQREEGHRGKRETEELLAPLVTIYHSLDSVTEMSNVEID